MWRRAAVWKLNKLNAVNQNNLQTETVTSEGVDHLFGAREAVEEKRVAGE